MIIEAECILRSVLDPIFTSENFKSKEIITLVLKYPRFIHSEFMTHRAFSRNASSSRAIPVKTSINNIIEDPAFFVHIGSNQPGMQAGAEVSDETKEKFYQEWLDLMNLAVEHASRWSAPIEAGGYGIHKQVANRVLEPWSHISVIVTATEWDNFFKLRDHPDAQPEFRQLAIKMKEAINAARLQYVRPGEWHLPFITDEEKEVLLKPEQIKCSIARCARVSYLTHEGKTPTLNKDFELYDRLVGGDPIHASPTEHQAIPVASMKEYNNASHLFGNFDTWLQYRKLLESGRGMS